MAMDDTTNHIEAHQHLPLLESIHMPIKLKSGQHIKNNLLERDITFEDIDTLFQL